ncbi:MAG TPA: VC0807 family protein [Candidatus Baltobacteraceae bacterium]
MQPDRQVATEERPAPEETPMRFLWESFRALLPTLAIDVGGTTIVYYALARFYPSTSIWPILGASLVPTVSNVVNLVRRKTVDIVGLLILLGMMGGLIPALFGGTQRLLLIRESFVSGLLGLVLLVSPFLMRRPIGYYVIREVLTANDALPEEHFEVLWRTAYFRHGIRVVTLAWGVVLLGELVLRAFMALTMNVGLVVSVSPVIYTTLMLLAGVATAIWLSGAISRALR